MDEVRQSLTAEERALLSDLFEQSEIIRALEKALSKHQLLLAMTTMASEVEWEQYNQFKGEVRAAKWVIDFLKDNHKKWQKDREKTKANQEAVE